MGQIDLQIIKFNLMDEFCVLGAGISNLADAFAKQIGNQRKSVAIAAAKSGSKLYRPPFYRPPYYPIQPWKPVQIAKDQRYIDSCLYASGSFGKRESIMTL